MSEKLQKVLARAGFGSRRELEEWIEAGRVKVNRETAKLGDRATKEDKIFVDGKLINSYRLFATQRRVIVYHKNVGTVCTRSDPEHRKTIYHDLPKLRGGRWIGIGRLDLNTSGLLLLTTDGELANRLMHPSYEVEREYLVRVLGAVSPAVLKGLLDGVELDDGVAKFDTITDVGGEGANHWYRVTLHEGRNREVRRLWEAQGIQVSRLSRIRFASIEMPRRLMRGNWQELEEKQVEDLCNTVGLRYTAAAENTHHNPLSSKAPVKKRVMHSGKEPATRKKPVAARNKRR